MEDASKAIEIAIGVIIFIVALTVTILIYTNLNQIIRNTLLVNTTTADISTHGVEDISLVHDIVYDESEIFFMIQNMKRKTDATQEDFVKDQYSPYNDPDMKIVIIDPDAIIDPGAIDSIDLTLYSYTVQEFIEKFDVTKAGNEFNKYFKDKLYTIEYKYDYVDLENLNVANHKVKEMRFREIDE